MPTPKSPCRQQAVKYRNALPGEPQTLITILMVMVSLACGRQASTPQPLQAMTNRAQTSEPYAIVIAQLTEPALLAQVQPTPDGHLAIPDEASKRLQDEQQRFLAALDALSPDTQVLYRYRLVLNALALRVPRALLPKLQAAGITTELHESHVWQRPLALSATPTLPPSSSAAELIGARRAYDELRTPAEGGELVRVDGRGVRLGIIDTGLDYTHAALGGSGDTADYLRINPRLSAPPSLYPNAKVVGGIDLVGSHYDEGAPCEQRRLPHPDANPLDESGHGSHVASIAAGLALPPSLAAGIAPGAELYAIKAFGRQGTSAEHVLLAAFEYAADPNGDLNPDDHLDIVNLSLGTPFGLEEGLCSQAISHLTKAGTLLVTSAGNSGAIPYSIGSPGVSSAAITVAATTLPTQPDDPRPLTIAKFSAWGPRSLDSAFKPDLAAPGSSITAALVGSGQGRTVFSGTSTAAPHVSGALALLRQYRPNVPPALLKDLLLSTSRILPSLTGTPLAIAAQGTGFLQVYEALTTPLAVSPAAVALGEQALSGEKTLGRLVSLYNLSDQDLHLRLSSSSSSSSGGISLGFPSELSLAPHTHLELPLAITVAPHPDQGSDAEEAAAYLLFHDDKDQLLGKVSLMAMVRPLSQISAHALQVAAATADEAPGALASIAVSNASPYPGKAYFFNLLRQGPQRSATVAQPQSVRDLCEVASIGYRTIKQPDSLTGERDWLQLAIELRQPLTNWHHCEVSAQLARRRGGLVEQELLATDLATLLPDSARGRFASVLADAGKMRQIRQRFDAGDRRVDYEAAVIGRYPLQAYPHSSLVILTAPIDALLSDGAGTLHLAITTLVATSVHRGRAEFLISQELGWHELNTRPEAQAYYDLPLAVDMDPASQQTIQFVKGTRPERLIAYYPANRAAQPDLHAPGKQAQLIRPRYNPQLAFDEDE